MPLRQCIAMRAKVGGLLLAQDFVQKAIVIYASNSKRNIKPAVIRVNGNFCCHQNYYSVSIFPYYRF